MYKLAFSIFHTADIHGRFSLDKVRRLQSIISECDTPKVLVDSGDIIKGGHILFHPIDSSFRYIDMLNYTAICMGNREFNYFRSVLYWRLRKYPFLVCNLEDRSRRGGFFRPSLHLTIADFRLTIIGVTKPQYGEGHFWEKVTGFRFLNFFSAIKGQIDTYYKLTDLFLILSHLGVEDDLKVASFLYETYPALSDRIVILGGHDHVECLHKDPILVLHTKPYLCSISHLEVLFNVNSSRKWVTDIVISRKELDGGG